MAGLQRGGAGIDGRHPADYLDRPRRFGIGIRKAIETGKEFRGNVGSGVRVESQGVGQH